MLLESDKLQDVTSHAQCLLLVLMCSQPYCLQGQGGALQRQTPYSFFPRQDRVGHFLCIKAARYAHLLCGGLESPVQGQATEIELEAALWWASLCFMRQYMAVYTLYTNTAKNTYILFYL